MTTIDRNPAEAYRRYFTRYAVGYNRYADGGGNPPKHDRNYNTVLTPEQEVQFQQWLKTMPVYLKSDYDYDLRGAWLAGVNPDEYLHMPDTYKKPWHPTFSDESIYSGPQMQGGHWDGDNFTTSPYNKYMQGFKYGNWGANSFGDGGGIHIKKENRGKFSEAAKRAGYSTQAYARHIMANKENYSPTLRKRANFALNASKWHAYGGYVFADGGKPDDPPAIKPVNLLGDIQVPLTSKQGNVMASDNTSSKTTNSYKQLPSYNQIKNTEAKIQYAKQQYPYLTEEGAVEKLNDVYQQQQESVIEYNNPSYKGRNEYGEEGIQAVAPIIPSFVALNNPVGMALMGAAGVGGFFQAGRASANNENGVVNNFIDYMYSPEGSMSLLGMYFGAKGLKGLKSGKLNVSQTKDMYIDGDPFSIKRFKPGEDYDITDYVNMSKNDVEALENIAKNKGNVNLDSYETLTDIYPEVDFGAMTADELNNFAKQELEFIKDVKDDIKTPLVVDNNPDIIILNNGQKLKYNTMLSRLQRLYGSPEYKKRLIAQASENPSEVQRKLFKNLASAGRYKSNHNYLIEKRNGRYFIKAGENAHRINKNGVYINGNGQREMPNYIHSTNNSTKRSELHEYVHASDDSKALQDVGLNNFLSEIETLPGLDKTKGAQWVSYIKRPEEIRARAIETLVEWRDAGINIGDGAQIDKMIDRIYSDIRFNKGNSNFKNLMDSFSKKDIKKIMKKIAILSPAYLEISDNEKA